MKKHSSKRSAFTLLEIMMVVAIIGMLLTAAMKAGFGKLEMAKQATAKAEFQSLASSLMLYQSANGFLPTTEQGLNALVTRPVSDPRPRQWTQLSEKLPQDPWGKDYIYVRPGKHNTDSYDLSSMGPDGKPDTEDDICNWEK